MSEAMAAQAGEVFLDRFPKLDDRARRQFTESIQELQLRTYVLRGGALRVNPAFAFIDRHEELVAAYLALGGWRLSLDRTIGVARLFHPESSGKVRFNKNETILLLCLRLLYHQGRQTINESSEIRVSVGAIREKLHELLPANAVRPFLSRKVMGSALRSFERFRIVGFAGASYLLSDESELVLQPAIEQLVSAQGLDAIQAALAELNGARTEEDPAVSVGPEQSDEEGASV